LPVCKWIRSAGKLADVVLLDANPLDDIANTQTIWRVVAGGRVSAEPQPLLSPDEIEPDDEDSDLPGHEGPKN
jgi:hypothetical protein